MPKKKKRLVFNKIELLETSAVGTPAYPDAHFSFHKALSNSITERGDNLEDNMEKNEEIVESVEQTSEVQPEVSEEPQTQPTEEKVEEQPTEEAKEESEEPQPVPLEVPEEKEEVKSFTLEDFKKAVSEEVEKLLKDKRGLIEKKEEGVNKSLGQIAIESGLFR